jgi:uncharacterized protein YqgV (UPF0045/DUF77 family)
MESNKKANEINIDELIKSVYSKIANWHNDDTTASGLKFTVLEIIEECTKNTIKELGLNDVVTEVKLDEEAKKEALKNKD